MSFGGVGRGVAWFLPECAEYIPPKRDECSESQDRIERRRRRRRRRRREVDVISGPSNTKLPVVDEVNVIDIEDEDLSFTSFFVGMEVKPGKADFKRPMVEVIQGGP